MLMLLGTLLLVLLGVVVAEILSRRYWQRKYHIPFSAPERICQAFYPVLEKVEKKNPNREDEYFNILFLGGSAIERAWGEVEICLTEQLARRGYRNIRVFNLGMSGLNSLDFFYQYQAVEQFNFDLVLFYPGGAEVKVNNVPSGLFKNDYSHFAHFKVGNYLISHHGKVKFSLAYGLQAFLMQLHYQRNIDNYVPYRVPREKWLRFGSDIRSLEPFENNVSKVMEMAEKRGEEMVVMTYAFYTSAGYSFEKFQKKELDYILHILPYEKFGIKENVIKTYLLHNETIRALSKQHHNVTLVDQEIMMNDYPGCFNDPFHLTVEGSMKFVENLMPSILSAIDRVAQDNR